MLTPGQTLASKYRVVRPIGQGGMGEVVEAEHLVTGRRVALKVILGGHDGASALRFERETRAMAAIESPHIVSVLDAGVDAATGQPFLAMEYLRGKDLASALARMDHLPSDLVARLGRQACLGLERAHAAGVVHRDVKAANVFLAEQGGGEVVVKLLDFGIAKAVTDSSASHALTRTGHLVGSPLYMSPEQAAGDVTIDGRSDVFSLGVVLYEALSGSAPHAGITSFPKLLVAVSHTPAPPLADRVPDVDPRLAAIVARALELDRDARFASAREMGEALSALVVGDPRIHAIELGLTLEDAVLPRVSVPPISSFATTELATASTTRASVRTPTTPPPKPSKWPIGVGVAVAVAAAAWSFARTSAPPSPSAAPPSAPPQAAMSTSAATVQPSASTQSPAPSAVASAAPSTAPASTATAARSQVARPISPAAAAPSSTAPPAPKPPATPGRVGATEGFE